MSERGRRFPVSKLLTTFLTVALRRPISTQNVIPAQASVLSAVETESDEIPSCDVLNVSDDGHLNYLELLRQQTVLAKFGELALTSNDLDEILTEACRLIEQALGTHLAKVMELQEDGKTLLVRAGVGWKPGVVGEVTVDAAEDTSEGHALKTGEPMTSPDILTETRFIYPPFLVENGVRACANVIIIGGHGRPPFGILQVDSRVPRQFTDSDISFVRSYANLLAAAVDRLRVIREMQVAKERLRLALEAGELGSWEIDLANGAVTNTPRTLQIFGYTDMPPAWTYDNFLSHVLPEERTLIAAMFDKAVDTGVEWHFECRIRRASDGEVRWIEARGRHTGGRSLIPPTHIIGILADITARKATQHALEELVAGRTRELAEASMLRDEAERLNRVKSEFLANMSHEIRTPMNGIIGMTDLLLRTKLDDGQRRFADAVHLSAEALLKLINNVLDISKLESSKVELEEIDFRVADCVVSTVNLLRPMAEQKELGLFTQIDPIARRALKGDPTRFSQILQNLLSNAIKFTDSGVITLKVSGSEVNNDRIALRIEVQDAGCGFDQAGRGKLFQKFQQADGSITRRFGGSGLGLALCRQFVTLMGGEIGAESEPGQGSLFWINLTLPLGSEQAILPNAGSSVLLGLRALVMDASDVDRVIFEQHLTAEGMEVTTVTDSDTAPDSIGKAIRSGRPFDIVIMGQYKPHMTGPELARVLRHQFGARTPHLVLVSARDVLSKSDPDRALFQACLAKPLRGVELVACLVRILATPGSDVPRSVAVGSRDDAVRVLFVDDNEVNRLLGVTLLEQAGYTVETAADGVQALDAVTHGSFGIVFMDVQMPKMDGLEATKAIRALGNGEASLPIIAVTANAMVGDRETYLRAGMTDYLSKPLDAKQFLAMVLRWTGSAHAASPAQVVATSAPATDFDALPLIDQAVFGQLQAAIPAANFQSIIRSYLSTDFFAGVEENSLGHDFEALGFMAHTCKGASASIGAVRLSAVAADLEGACHAKTVSSSILLQAELRRVSKRTHIALGVLMPPRFVSMTGTV